MGPVAVVDAGPLIASVIADEPHHHACLSALQDPRLLLIIPALCVAEASYLIERKAGPLAEATFLAGLSHFEVVAPEPEDWARIAELVRQYADWPLGGTDASVVALAERLKADTIITLDRRHFERVRPRHVERFTLLPE
ncbi:MAG: PIN domain-containing protein [Dehalococcoidia bacterium]|nr:PIN domain-containing protein [Dehalococcoidia bacterium]